MTHLLLALLALFSPTQPDCDAWANSLLIDYDERSGIVVIDASTGDELDGTICVPTGAPFTTTGDWIELIIGGESLGSTGVLDTEGVMCVAVDDMPRCSCNDSNGTPWSQDCPPGFKCSECCYNAGGTWTRAPALRLTPPDAGDW